MADTREQAVRLDRTKAPPGLPPQPGEKALDWAWTCYEMANDPPGSRIGRDVSEAPFIARAAKWAHYWRCVRLTCRMEAHAAPRFREMVAKTWPDVLDWSDEDLTKVEGNWSLVPATPGLDGRGDPIDPEAEYYVQEAAGSARGLVGNCMRFWGPNNRLYTCELGKAGIYKGRACLSMRPTDVPWPVEFIRAHAVLHVRADMLPKTRQSTEPT